MLLATILFAQLATAPRLADPAHAVAPVLAFPERGLDDSAAYQGYRTRFFRDAARNTVQIYLDREGRVVNLLADAEDESVGFTARDARGAPASLAWGSDSAIVARRGRTRTLDYQLAADSPDLEVGWLLLGSMRVERDFQYAGKQRAPFASPAFRLEETEHLVAALARLPAAERARHLALLQASSVAALRARLTPTVALRTTGGRTIARIVQPSLDGRDTLALELSVDPREATMTRGPRTISLRARGGRSVRFGVRVATTGGALTPLAREEIFTPEFLAFLAAARDSAGRDAAASVRARRLERQVRGVELLVSREKLMAGLPNYATYFGRDMLVTALMMRSIWRDQMSQFAIAAALRKLGPGGEVSHEEALGGQAVREGARDYATAVDASLGASREGRRAAADSLLAQARSLLRDLRRPRENYHMIDDELQLAVLAGRWLADSTVSDARKRAFLLDSTDSGEPRVVRLLRELALVSRMTGAYAQDAVVTNLISFARRDSTHWASQSWRDSGAGYANGRFAMDVNAIWAPHALEGIRDVLATLRRLGIPADSVRRGAAGVIAGSPLEGWARDTSRLTAATTTWWNAARHFVVALTADSARALVAARVAAMPPAERAYWSAVASRPDAAGPVRFLALSLDSAGRPIGVANSDVATGIFLGVPRSSASAEDMSLRDGGLFVRPYPVGLFIEGIGPVVANDAYATPDVWRSFERDSYHGPRVVWGREVNLFLLGAAARPELRTYLRPVLAAVEASGFHSELWSYEVRDGWVMPARYGIASDVQLWSTTDLAVQFALSKLR
ncbi:MAG TPA: hypothetical protein VHM30_10105 [Gemmatimonadaceae bacterium]|nr:hypothetical protein [Gemmatimonadaceae bacterium]